MRGASIEVSVIGASPFFCRSAQTEEGKNEHDDHDETDEVDDAVHNVLHEYDDLWTGVAPFRSRLRGRGRLERPSLGRSEVRAAVSLAPFDS
jgi:hypothetical protein